MSKYPKDIYLKYGLVEECFEHTLEKCYLEANGNSQFKAYSEIYSTSKGWVEKVKDIRSVKLPKNFMSILIVGGSGTGKSFLGSLICKELLDEGVQSPRYTLQHIVERYYTDWTLPPEVLGGSMCVFIDDIGLEIVNTKTHIKKILAGIVKIRAEKNAPTILATSEPIEILKVSYGEGFIDTIKSRFITYTLPNLNLKRVLSKERRESFLKSLRKDFK